MMDVNLRHSELQEFHAKKEHCKKVCARRVKGEKGDNCKRLLYVLELNHVQKVLSNPCPTRHCQNQIARASKIHSLTNAEYVEPLLLGKCSLSVLATQTGKELCMLGPPVWVMHRNLQYRLALPPASISFNSPSLMNCFRNEVIGCGKVHQNHSPPNIHCRQQFSRRMCAEDHTYP